MSLTLRLSSQGNSSPFSFFLFSHPSTSLSNITLPLPLLCFLTGGNIIFRVNHGDEGSHQSAQSKYLKHLIFFRFEVRSGVGPSGCSELRPALGEESEALPTSLGAAVLLSAFVGAAAFDALARTSSAEVASLELRDDAGLFPFGALDVDCNLGGGGLTTRDFWILNVFPSLEVELDELFVLEGRLTEVAELSSSSDELGSIASSTELLPCWFLSRRGRFALAVGGGRVWFLRRSCSRHSLSVLSVSGISGVSFRASWCFS
jgi:hypothetical protein